MPKPTTVADLLRKLHQGGVVRTPNVTASDVMSFLHGRASLHSHTAVCNAKARSSVPSLQHGQGKLRLLHLPRELLEAGEESSLHSTACRGPRRPRSSSRARSPPEERATLSATCPGNPARRSPSRASWKLASCPCQRRTVRHWKLFTSCSGRSYAHADLPRTLQLESRRLLFTCLPLSHFSSLSLFVMRLCVVCCCCCF